MATGTRSRGRTAGGPRSVIPRLGPSHAFLQTFSLSTDAVTQWTDESGNGLHLTPVAGNPDSRRYWFGGRRGVSNQAELTLAAEKTFSGTGDWEIWMVVEINAAGAQELLQSADTTDFVLFAAAGQINIRIGGTQKTIAPTSTISDGTAYVVRITHAAAGGLECYVNGTAQAQSQSSTADFDWQLVGNAEAASDAYIGAIVAFDRALTTAEAVIVDGELDKYRYGCFVPIGASNSNDSIEGYVALGDTYLFGDDYNGYNSKPLWHDADDVTWHDLIGSWGLTPWSRFRSAADTTDVETLRRISGIWLHVMLAGHAAGTNIDATMQTQISDIISTARTELVDQGHFSTATDCPVYVSPMATYESDSTCAQLTNGNVDLSVQVRDYVTANITNCSRGPTIVSISEARSDVNGSTGACHVNETAKQDDGRVLRRFFEKLAAVV